MDELLHGITKWDNMIDQWTMFMKKFNDRGKDKAQEVGNIHKDDDNVMLDGTKRDVLKRKVELSEDSTYRSPLTKKSMVRKQLFTDVINNVNVGVINVSSDNSQIVINRDFVPFRESSKMMVNDDILYIHLFSYQKDPREVLVDTDNAHITRFHMRHLLPNDYVDSCVSTK